MSDRLPVQEHLDQIVGEVIRGRPVVLKAPPGAGKTTCLPPAILNADGMLEGQVLLVQPRRLAARAAASRIAQLCQTNLGDDVGYHVRFDKRLSGSTRLVAMTTGVLLRRLIGDPLLDGVACVILDEFHERSLELDLALGMLQRIRTALRPELRLVVMSATLEPGPIVEFLGDAAAIVSEGRSYPVQIQQIAVEPRERIENLVAAELPTMLQATDGDVLVFLPGVGEIRRTHNVIANTAEQHDCQILELYGELAPDQQAAVLDRSPERKIILATNVAETSVTIPGVTGVIDSGTARVMRFDSRVGLPKLQLEPISQASASQRSGRAGRTQPGICYRLWSAASDRSRRQQDDPEVQRSDFCQAMLTLAAWGEKDVMAFPWLTKPPAEAVDRAKHLLVRLGAINEAVGLTAQGRKMVSLPLHPRLARLVIEGSRLGIKEDAVLVAALLGDRDPFRGKSGARWPRPETIGCDISNRLDRIKSFAADQSTAVPNTQAAKQILRIAKQIQRLVPKDAPTGPKEAPIDDEDAPIDDEDAPIDDVETAPIDSSLGRALLAAYPDRIARRRSADDPRGVMVGGRGVRLDRQSAVKSGEFFLCVDVDSKGSEATVRVASQVDPSWLNSDRMRTSDETFYHEQSEAVVARRRSYYDDLCLREWPIECVPSEEVADLLASQARLVWKQPWPSSDPAVQSWIARIRFLQQHMPELDLSPLDDRAIDEVLLQLCRTRTSMQQLRSAPWIDHLSGLYDYAQLQSIDKHAPPRMEVPSGNRIAIAYQDDKPPRMQVRIQELFGWKETPRLAGGHVNLQLHLLGPNHRPQQVTEDLESFWSETYHVVRKELKRRYPKHHWPDDPANATATRNALKPR